VWRYDAKRGIGAPVTLTRNHPVLVAVKQLTQTYERRIEMGLLDQIFGRSQQGGQGGMSPLTMLLLGVLAYRAYQGRGGAAGGGLGGMLGNILGGGQARAAPGGGDPAGGGLGGMLGDILGGGQARSAPSGGDPAGGPASGDLGDLLRGGLGGLLAGGAGGAAGGGAAGGALNDALRELVERMQQNGHGDIAHSWVGSGPNQSITPDQLRDALGDDTVKSLAEQAGINQVQLLDGLSQELPEAVDQLTPDGQIPEDDDTRSG